MGQSRDEHKGFDEFNHMMGGESSSHVSGKDGKIDASKLSDMIIGDGTLLGVPMPQETISGIRKFLPAILFFATDKGQDWATHKWDAKTGKIVGIAIAFVQQILETVSNFYNLVTSLNNLHNTMKPAAKAAGSSSALTMDNEAIQDLRGKIVSMFAYGMLDTVIGAVTTALPNLFLVMSKSKEKTERYAGKEELEATGGNAEKVADVLESRLHGGGALGSEAKKGLTGAQIAAGEKKLIERKLTAYNNEFLEFSKKNTVAYKEKISTSIKGINENISEIECTQQLDKLGEMGVASAADLKTKIERSKSMTLEQRATERNYRKDKTAFGQAKGLDAYGRPKTVSTLEFDADRKALIAEFKEQFAKGKSLDPIVDNALRKQYARDNGAFNKEWKKHLDEDSQKDLTKEEEIKKFFSEETAERQNLQKELDATLKEEKGIGNKVWDFSKALPSLIAGFARDFVTRLLIGKSLEKLKRPLAAERVAHLAKVLSGADGNQSKEVPPMVDKERKGGKNSDDSLGKSLSYAEYIHEIFQAQQSYHLRAKVGDRFTSHFDEVHWKDDEIRKMSDESLTPYEYAIKHMMMNTVDKKWDVSAILNFLGDRKGNRLVHTDGQTFGPKGAGTEDKDVKAAIKKMIDANAMQVKGGQKLTADELSERMSNWLFKIEDIKHELESKEGDPQWRAFALKLYSDTIMDEGVMSAHLGVDGKHCLSLRTEPEGFNDMFDGVMNVLARKLKEDPDGFKEICPFTDSEKKLIAALSKRCDQRDDAHFVDLPEDNKETIALTTIALNAAMKLGKQPEFREEVKLAIEELHKPKETKAEREHAKKKSREMREEHPRTEDKYSAQLDGVEENSMPRDRPKSHNSLDDKNGGEREHNVSHVDRVNRHKQKDRHANYATQPIENRNADGFGTRVQQDKSNASSITGVQ